MGVAESVSTSTCAAHLLDVLLVRHAEALLLVDDEQAEVLELDVLLQQLVRADHEVALARAHIGERLAHLRLRARSGESMRISTGKP